MTERAREISQSERMIQYWSDSSWRSWMISRQSGHSPTDETKRKISAKNTGLKRTEEVKDQISDTKTGGLRKKILPLLVRGLLIDEAREIWPQFGTKQIRWGRDRWRNNPDSTGLERPTFIEESNTKRKAQLKRARDKHRFPEEEAVRQKHISFARELQEAGFITRDFRFWNLLFALYEKEGRRLPEEPALQLQLEGFLISRIAAERGNSIFIDTYFFLGQRVGGKVFLKRIDEEHRFIAGHIEREIRRSQPSSPSLAHQ